MIDKYYSISNLVFLFISPKDISDTELWSDFITEPSEPDIVINVIPGKLPDIQNAFYQSYPVLGGKKVFSCRVIKGDNEIDLYIDENEEIWDSKIFNALDFPSLLIHYNRIMCHSSFVIRDGEAILFVGNKQVGKSTQAKLWEKYGNAEIINGDRSILMAEGNRLFACGTPYCGSSKIALNRVAPVKAIVFLSKSSDNLAVFVDNYSERLKLIIQHLSYNEEQIDKMLDIVQLFCVSVPFYKLSCVPEKDAVLFLERILWK